MKAPGFRRGDKVTYDVKFRGPCAPMQPRPEVIKPVVRTVRRVYDSGGLAMVDFVNGGSMPAKSLRRAT